MSKNSVLIPSVIAKLNQQALEVIGIGPEIVALTVSKVMHDIESFLFGICRKVLTMSIKEAII